MRRTKHERYAALFSLQYVFLEMNFSDCVLQFIAALKFPDILPPGFQVMYPFSEKEVMEVCAQFYQKFYGDNHSRRMIIGINPGRFGGGVTGIPFTDPIRLQQECGIKNNWPQKLEWSSVYIYEMINGITDVTTFYKNFYFTSVSPLGFIKNKINQNYYHDKKLKEAIKPFVLDCFNKQFTFGIHRDIAFCLGSGENFQYLSTFNEEHKLFEKIVPLEHPRFIMQYRRKKKSAYIEQYRQQLGAYLD